MLTEPGLTFGGLALLAVLLVVAGAIAQTRSLFAIVMLSAIYSLVSAIWFFAADAVDVAFTEAAVGAGLSTAILLAAMLLTTRKALPEKPIAQISALIVCLVTGALLIYATFDLPAAGDPASPANSGVGTAYSQINAHDIGIPNVVTSILASYRGFDTLGEVIVVFIAGVSVALLLGFGERALAESIQRDAVPKSRGGTR